MYLFTQTIDTKVKDNKLGDEGRKIKEKQESLLRTLENRVNVPLNPKHTENITVTNDYTLDNEINNANSIETDSFDSQNDTKYNNSIFEELVSNLNSDYDVMNEPVQNANVYAFEQPQPSQIPSFEEPVNTRSSFDVSSTYSEINEAKNTILGMREKALNARKEADESDRKLEMLIAKNEEIQRQYREAEMKSRAIEQEIANMLQNQKNVLTQEMQKTESIINDSNRRVEKNNGKIIEFQGLIKSAEEKTNEINARISRSEELLNSLSSALNYDYDDYKEDSDYRKVA